jgi:hypothetical protein
VIGFGPPADLRGSGDSSDRVPPNSCMKNNINTFDFVYCFSGPFELRSTKLQLLCSVNQIARSHMIHLASGLRSAFVFVLLGRLEGWVRDCERTPIRFVSSLLVCGRGAGWGSRDCERTPIR